MLGFPGFLWTIKLKKLEFPGFCELLGLCSGLQGFVNHQAEDAEDAAQNAGVSRVFVDHLAANAAGFVDHLEFSGTFAMHRAETLEFVGFFGEICRVSSLPHPAKIVQ